MRVAFIFLFLITACKNSVQYSHAPIDKIKLYPTDVLPEDWANEKIEESKLFNLPLLFKKPDHFELRIVPRHAPWLRFGMGKDLFVFKSDSVGWSGFHYYSYTVPYNDQDGKLQYLEDPKLGQNTFLVKKLQPKCGWSNFSDSINYFNIEKLPTQELINGFKHKAMLDGIVTNSKFQNPMFTLS